LNILTLILPIAGHNEFESTLGKDFRSPVPNFDDDILPIV